MRIGIVGSSGGSVLAEALRIMEIVEPGKHEVVVLTDRPCGLEALANERGLQWRRLEERSNQQFSARANEVFTRAGGVDLVALFFSRLVTSELYDASPVFNIHPSLLPAFKGFNPIDQALAAGARFLGATLHKVDETIDGGPIVAQTCMPLSRTLSRAELERASFIQKLYLFLLLVEMGDAQALTVQADGRIRVAEEYAVSDRCSPLLINEATHREVLKLQSQFELKVVG